MRDLSKPILLIAAILVLPVLPFLMLGESFEGQVEGWLDESLPPYLVAAMVIGLLAGDVFLPVPSSVLGTFAGNRLGFLGATAASWLGLTLGAILAFALARALGRPLALRWTTQEELDRIDRLSGRFGPWALVLARPVPVLAEASVLLMGTTRLSWGRFFVVIGLSNLGIAVVYSALGEAVQLPVALVASIALPLAAAVLARKILIRR